MMTSELNRIPCKYTELCLDLSLNCGQSFRWKKRPTGEWVGVLGGHLWILTQDESSIRYQVVSPSSDKQDSTKEGTRPTGRQSAAELENFLKDYFQFDIELDKLYEEWSKCDLNFKKVADDYKGVRMLRQDPVENLFAFICSSNNNIQRISGMVENLCLHFGHQLLTHEGVSYYNFPTIEAICKPGVEAKLRNLGFGYRAKFIQQSAEKVLANGGRNWLLSLRNVTYQEAKSALMTLPGVGAKVADCICLMSLNHSAAIPVDTHVFQIAKSSYMPHLSPLKSVTERVYGEISAHFRTLWGPYAGWAHSVLFSADLRHLKAVKANQKRPESSAKKSQGRATKKQKK